jgi:hypothetical protein
MPVSLLKSLSHNSGPEPLLSSDSLLLPHVTTMAISDTTQDHPASAILSAVDTCAQPATVPLEIARFLPAGGDVPPVPPQLLPGVSQELGAGVSQEHAPYPAGWFAPPGAAPCFQGYPSPFYGPYGGWGMFPNMDPSHHGAPTVPLPGGNTLPWRMFPNMDPFHHSTPTVPLPGGNTPPQVGRQGGVPFNMPGFYFWGQPFAFQNSFPIPNMPRTWMVGMPLRMALQGGRKVVPLRVVLISLLYCLFTCLG